MIAPLYQHQKRIIDEDKKWTGLFLSTGSGKSRTALELAQGKILCIVPKQQKLDRNFENTAEKYGIKKDITVVSKEEFRRDWEKLPVYNTVIVDEFHNMLGITTDTYTKDRVIKPKSSEMFKSLYYYLKKHPPERFYALTATPASKPMNVYAIMCIFDKNTPDYFSFRSKYYFEIKKGYRTLWVPRKDERSQNELAEIIKSYGFTGQLSSFIDLPEQTDKTIYVNLTKEQRQAISEVEQTQADPMVLRARKRTIENGILYDTELSTVSGKEFMMTKKTKYFPTEKLLHIEQLCDEFPKVLIFANYIAQIDQIATHLKSLGKKVHILHGQVKDRESVIFTANKDVNCVVVAQCALSAGYELPDFRCTIFASKSYRHVDFQQGRGRVCRINNPQKNLYVHLVVKDGIDELCHKSIMNGEDFYEKQMN